MIPIAWLNLQSDNISAVALVAYGNISHCRRRHQTAVSDLSLPCYYYRTKLKYYSVAESGRLPDYLYPTLFDLGRRLSRESWDSDRGYCLPHHIMRGSVSRNIQMMTLQSLDPGGWSACSLLYWLETTIASTFWSGLRLTMYRLEALEDRFQRFETLVACVFRSTLRGLENWQTSLSTWNLS